MYTFFFKAFSQRSDVNLFFQKIWFFPRHFLKSIKVKFASGWARGDIIYYGSENKCNKHGKNIENGIQINTDEDSESTDDQSFINSQSSKKKKLKF